MNPFWQLLLSRIRTFIREPSAVFWVYAFPLIMVFSLGIAFRSERIEEIPVDVQQHPQNAAVIEALRESAQLSVRESSAEEAQRRLRRGQTELIVSIDETPTTGSVPPVRYTWSPTRPGSLVARNTVDDTLQRAFGREDVIRTTDEEVIEPGSRYIDFLVPGLIGMGLMGGGMWGVGFATVDLRIRKLLKRFVATPMKRSHFLAAMICSRMMFTVPEVVIILGCSWWFFDVTVQGELWLLGLVLVSGAIQFSGIGLLVASRATTVETVSGLMNAVMMPMWIASGIFFSADRFPEIVQPLIQCLPLTTLIDTLRLVMLEGAGLQQVAGSVLVILGWGVISFVLALRMFRWQ